MCGIFGSVGIADRQQLAQAARRLHHRGPDAFGEAFDAANQVYLGHCRLAIIDLHQRADQPLGSGDGQQKIVFNGEIYNYQNLRRELEALGRTFHTASDTEVCLQAYLQWGTACLSRLTGMFAFAIWDAAQQQLFLARDRLGIKPLYVSRWSGGFAFASEAKALLDLPGTSRHIDPQALVTFLQYGYVVGGPSIWQGIERLPPASWMKLDLGRGTETSGTYWKLAAQPADWTLTEAAERFQDLFQEIVQDHLIADVPLGLFLSGGLDSGIIAANLPQGSRKHCAYTMAFGDWEQNELQDACAVARHCGLAHVSHTLQAEDFSCISQWLDIFDEPLGDTAVFPNLAIAREARPHMKVALSGDGGDELFGGYRWYQQVEARPWRRRLHDVVEQARRLVGAGRSFPDVAVGQLEYHRFLSSPSFSSSEIQAIFPWITAGDREAGTHRFTRHFHPGGGRYRRWQDLDMATYLVDNNLVRMDRASMAHSLEVRVPFCDHRLVEFAASLPDELCVSNGNTKVLMRQAAKQQLPEGIATRRKQGFSFPLNQLWPLDNMLAELHDGSLVREQIVDAHALQRIVNAPRRGHFGYRIWLLVVLEHWCRRWYSGSQLHSSTSRQPFRGTA